MNQFKMDELMECFGYIEDPRVQGRSKHLFIDILVLSICATLCGAEACTEIEEFGKQKEDWLKQYLELPCGIPSHDTIGRVLSIIDPLQMEAAFRNWVELMSKDDETKRLSLDGKSVAGTERKFTKHPLHIVSAYSHELGLSLMQTEAKYRGTGEVEAALECLQSLNLKGVTVMADAALSVGRIIEQIKVQEGEYVVPIKGNQKLSLKEMTEIFEKREKSIKSSVSNEEAHSRKEMRKCEVLPADKMSKAFYEKWIGVKTIIRVTRTREVENLEFAQRIKDETVSATKKREYTTYYVSSRALKAKEALIEIRSHWAIENNLHWHLDVAFREDQWKTRAKSLARSQTLIRKIAMNIIRTSKTKGSVKVRIKRAGWNNDFLAQLVFGQ